MMLLDHIATGFLLLAAAITRQLRQEASRAREV
jgi:hypothetical protein